jgi:hypothetical protein
MDETVLPENPDLAWDIGEGIDRERAIDFIMQFETTLCVYSASVEKLYSTYNIFFPREYHRKMVILPDPAAFHDTFSGIVATAVQMTGLYIIPGELINESGLYLANVKKDRSLGDRRIPFEDGMRTLMRNRPADDPFLPVLAKGDLRGFEESWPVLHLHRVKLVELAERSELDRTNIRNAVIEKLESLFVIQRKLQAQ